MILLDRFIRYWMNLWIYEFVDFCCEVQSTPGQAVVKGVCSSLMATATTTHFSYIDLVLGFTDAASQMKTVAVQAGIIWYKFLCIYYILYIIYYLLYMI